MTASRVKLVLLALTSGLAAFACAACTSSPAPSPPPNAADDTQEPPRFGGTTGFPTDASSTDQAGYALGGCAGGPEMACHGPGMAMSGLVLADTRPTNLVNVPSVERPDLMRVRPGDPARSYLYMKITRASGIDGVPMPKDSPPLDEASIAAIAAWIDAGAPDLLEP
ncbi:hypothetical protein [Labilithrix luteola]|uniref:hypothetical protein n=1 Tax=Labilithrix luteola TaxID=1391654 RepID=UPI0011BA84C7|nr:hypothetical protein [Labilithrix luteola]